MQEDHICDSNSLYVECATIDEKSITAYLKSTTQQAIRAIKTLPEYRQVRLKETVFVNVPRNAKDFCYVWIDSPEVVNVILGLNPNGTKREIVETKVIDDPTCDDDDWFAEPTTEKSITVLPPLITLLPLNVAGVDNEVKFGRFYCRFPDENCQHSALIATRVPAAVTNTMIGEKFSRFGVHGQPKVVRKGTTVFVNFEGTSNDAIFAGQLCMFSKFGTNVVRFTHPMK